MKNIKAFIHWTNYDKDGNIIGESEHEANSLVKAFLAHLLAHLSTSTVASIPDTTNTSRSVANSSSWSITGTSGAGTQGIVVGTGTTAVTLTDYNIQTAIVHGTGDGQLSYGGVTFDSSLTTSGSTLYFNISRTFTNNSGSNITINEVGLITASTNKFLLDRTLSTNTINNGNSSTCTYKISITV